MADPARCVNLVPQAGAVGRAASGGNQLHPGEQQQHGQDRGCTA